MFIIITCTAAQSVVYGGGSYAKYSILEYLPLSVAKRQASTDGIRSTISDAVSLWLRTEMVGGASLLLYMASETTGDEFYIQVHTCMATNFEAYSYHELI